MKKKRKNTRRTFIKNTTKTIAVGLVFSHLPNFSRSQIVGQDIIRLGLVGCGGRGTGAVYQALTSSKRVRLVAMGDVFQHELVDSFQRVSKDFPNQVDVPREKQFLGLEAYKSVIDASDAARRLSRLTQGR